LAVALHELQNLPVKLVQGRFHRFIVGKGGAGPDSALIRICAPFFCRKDPDYAAWRRFF
jgi:hypothetical protein